MQIAHDNYGTGSESKWVPVEGYEGHYEICVEGVIRRSFDAPFMKATKPGRVLTHDASTGYARVCLSIAGKSNKFLVHRLVAKQFLPGYMAGRLINHIDGNKLNNALSNLEWVTARENTAHAWRTGLAKPFSRDEHGATILDERGARAVCFLHYVHGIPQTILAEAYGITVSAISQACRKTPIEYAKS